MPGSLNGGSVGCHKSVTFFLTMIEFTGMTMRSATLITEEKTLVGSQWAGPSWEPDR